MPTLALIEATEELKAVQNLTSATKDKGAAQVEHLSCLAAVSSMMLGLVSGGTPEESEELYHYW